MPVKKQPSGTSTHTSVHGARGDRGQETTTLQRPKPLPGGHGDAWEGLLLDNCQYCGVPYRQNKSHEDPNSV